MPDVTAKAAAKRPFDERRLAVLMVQIFCRNAARVCPLAATGRL
jgi:hypothetical protein